eukprot:scaffold1637_cov410-Prasinococcus_capsulatus_cf.AAC.31
MDLRVRGVGIASDTYVSSGTHDTLTTCTCPVELTTHSRRVHVQWNSRHTNSTTNSQARPCAGRGGPPHVYTMHIKHSAHTPAARRSAGGGPTGAHLGLFWALCGPKSGPVSGRGVGLGWRGGKAPHPPALLLLQGPLRSNAGATCMHARARTRTRTHARAAAAVAVAVGRAPERGRAACRTRSAAAARPGDDPLHDRAGDSLVAAARRRVKQGPARACHVVVIPPFPIQSNPIAPLLRLRPFPPECAASRRGGGAVLPGATTYK